MSRRVVTITGAASGLGFAIAKDLAQQGWAISICDISPPLVAYSSQELSQIIGEDNLHAKAVDVKSQSEVDSWIKETIEKFGRIDAAVNVAGIQSKESGTPIWELNVDDFNQVQSVNVGGMLNCVRAVMAHMVEAHKSDGRGGSIVNFGSTCSVRGVKGLTAYTTSKHAVIGLTKVAALDGGEYGIRVNAVCPGPFETPMLVNNVSLENRNATAERLPLGRIARSEEITGIVGLLVSDKGSFCTGSTYVIDGGQIIQ